MSGGWVDFEEIKELVPITAALEHYRVKVDGEGENLRGKCPLHEGDGDRSLSVSPQKGLFFCFSCKKGGNVLDLVRELEGGSVRDAALLLRDSFLSGEGEPPPSPAAKVQPARKSKAEKPEEDEEKAAAPEINPPLGFSLRVDPDHEYGQSRGMGSSVFEYLEAGFCLSKGLFAGTFVFPLHNERSELVGYAGRALDNDEERKYRFPKGLKKRLLLFNFHREVAEQEDEVILVEGFFGLARVKELGFPCVALMGSKMTEEQEALLTTYFKRVVICLDADEAGRIGRDDCLMRLGRQMFVRAVDLPEGKQPDTVSREDLVMLLMKPRGLT